MLRLHCDAKVACTVLSRSGFGIDTWNGTSRMLRQMPSSVPEIAGRAALAARRLDPENPDCHNRPEHGQTGDSPACCVGRAVGFRSVHQRVVPIAHDSLLAAWLWGLRLPAPA